MFIPYNVILTLYIKAPWTVAKLIYINYFITYPSPWCQGWDYVF